MNIFSFLYFSGLGTYFNIKHGLRKDAIKVILEKLKDIEQWFLTQRKHAFYASSLLVVYEGDMQHNDLFMSCNQCNNGDCKCSTSSASHHTMSLDTADNTSSGATDSTDLTSSEVDTELSDQTDGSSMTASVSSISVDAQSCSINNLPVNNHNAGLADVRMIDFTHVFNVEDSDENYLYGLQNLISHMQQLLDLDL